MSTIGRATAGTGKEDSLVCTEEVRASGDVRVTDVQWRDSEITESDNKAADGRGSSSGL